LTKEISRENSIREVSAAIVIKKTLRLSRSLFDSAKGKRLVFYLLNTVIAPFDINVKRRMVWLLELIFENIVFDYVK